MTPKKIPLRRCTGCNESKPKKELVRVVKNAAGEVSLDLTGKKPGRGAYVCPSAACLAQAREAGVGGAGAPRSAPLSHAPGLEALAMSAGKL